jgi:hypothetical protein
VQVELRWSKEEAPGTGVANFVLCLDKENDDIGFFVAPVCPKKTSLGTCEVKRSRNGVGELVIVLQLGEDPVGSLG